MSDLACVSFLSILVLMSLGYFWQIQFYSHSSSQILSILERYSDGDLEGKRSSNTWHVYKYGGKTPSVLTQQCLNQATTDFQTFPLSVVCCVKTKCQVQHTFFQCIKTMIEYSPDKGCFNIFLLLVIISSGLKSVTTELE